MPSQSETETDAASEPGSDSGTESSCDTGVEAGVEGDISIRNTAKTKGKGDSLASSDMGAESAPENISRSVELISRLRKTSEESRTIMQRATVFYETNKMLESSRQLKTNTMEQLRRSRSK